MQRWSSGVVLAVAICVVLAVPGSTLSARTARTPTYGYVTSSLALPATSAEAKQYGRDITGDGHPDNALGQFFAALESQDLDFRSSTDAAVQGGQLLMLDSLRTPSFKKTSTATWQVFFAKKTDSPNFSGTGVFTVDGTAPRSVRLHATIRRHHVKTALGNIPIEFDFGGIVSLWLRKGEIDATCSRSTCSNGRITGVITKQDVNTQLIPQLAAQLSAIVARDCPGPDPASCVDGSTGKAVQSLFDANDDLVVSADELRKNGLIQALLAPDVDLNHDKVRDALSVGLGFTTVRAKIVH